MNYEEIDKIAELEGEVRDLRGESNTYINALQRIERGDDPISSEIAKQALVMGARS
ncbi:hypothetical protein [Maridesulfovibrio sp.]|uniref:hypothetical protein n=1 Tax=Maridesulfovibrio sp. TaxID=2795000 RepID=UPI003BA8C426